MVPAAATGAGLPPNKRNLLHVARSRGECPLCHLPGGCQSGCAGHRSSRLCARGHCARALCARGHCARALIQLLTGDRGRPHAAFLAVSSNYGQGGSGGRDLVYSPRSPFRLSRPGDGRKKARRRGDKAAKAGIRLAQGNAARSCPHRNVCMIGIAATQHLFC
jgi:hypothetical protein